MAIKASEVMKKKGSTEEKDKKEGKGASLLSWIGGRRGSNKKPTKPIKGKGADDEEE